MKINFNFESKGGKTIAQTIGQIKDGLAITAEVAGKAAVALGKTAKSAADLAAETAAMLRFGQALGVGIGEAQRLAKALGLSGEAAEQAVKRLQQLKNQNASAADQMKALANSAGLSADQFRELDRTLTAYNQKQAELTKQREEQQRLNREEKDARKQLQRDINNEVQQRLAASEKTGAARRKETKAILQEVKARRTAEFERDRGIEATARASADTPQGVARARNALKRLAIEQDKAAAQQRRIEERARAAQAQQEIERQKVQSATEIAQIKETARNQRAENDRTFKAREGEQNRLNQQALTQVKTESAERINAAKNTAAIQRTELENTGRIQKATIDAQSRANSEAERTTRSQIKATNDLAVAQERTAQVNTQSQTKLAQASINAEKELEKTRLNSASRVEQERVRGEQRIATEAAKTEGKIQETAARTQQQIERDRINSQNRIIEQEAKSAARIQEIQVKGIAQNEAEQIRAEGRINQEKIRSQTELAKSQAKITEASIKAEGAALREREKAEAQLTAIKERNAAAIAQTQTQANARVTQSQERTRQTEISSAAKIQEAQIKADSALIRTTVQEEGKKERQILQQEFKATEGEKTRQTKETVASINANARAEAEEIRQAGRLKVAEFTQQQINERKAFEAQERARREAEIAQRRATDKAERERRAAEREQQIQARRAEEEANRQQGAGARLSTRLAGDPAQVEAVSRAFGNNNVQAERALQIYQQLARQGVEVADIQQSLQRQLGLTADQFQTLSRAAQNAEERIAASRRQRTSPDLEVRAREALGRSLAANQQDISRVTQAFGGNTVAAQKAVDSYTKLQRSGAGLIQIQRELQKQLGVTGQQFQVLSQAISRAEETRTAPQRAAAEERDRRRIEAQLEREQRRQETAGQRQLTQSANAQNRLSVTLGGDPAAIERVSQAFNGNAIAADKAAKALAQLRFQGASSANAQKVLQQQLGVTTQQFRELERALDAIPRPLDEMAIGFAAAAGSAAAFTFLQQIVTDAVRAQRALESLRTALNFVSGGEIQGGQAFEFINRETDRLSLNLETAISNFTQLSAAAKGTELEGQGVREIFTSVAQAGRVLNLDLQKQEKAYLAITQIVSKNRVTQEELRQQLSEALPNAVQVFARALGVSTTELNKLIEEGRVGLPELLRFARQLAAETAGGVAPAVETTGAAFDRLQTSIFRFQTGVGETLEPVTRALTQFAAGALDGFNKLNPAIRATILATTGLITAYAALVLTIASLEAFQVRQAAQEILLQQRKLASIAITKAQAASQSLLAVATGKATAAQQKSAAAIGSAALKLGAFAAAAAGIAVVASAFEAVNREAGKTRQNIQDAEESLLRLEELRQRLANQPGQQGNLTPEQIAQQTRNNIEKNLNPLARFINDIDKQVGRAVDAFEKLTGLGDSGFLTISELTALNASKAFGELATASEQAFDRLRQTDITKASAEELEALTGTIGNYIGALNDAATPEAADVTRKAELIRQFEQLQKSAQQRIKVLRGEATALEELSKVERDALKQLKERQEAEFGDRQRQEEQRQQDAQRLADQQFNDRERQAEAAFKRGLQEQERVFNEGQRAEEKAFQTEQQNREQAFQREQEGQRRLFEADIERRRDALQKQRDAALQGADRQVQLEFAGTGRERAQLLRQFQREDAIRRRTEQLTAPINRRFDNAESALQKEEQAFQLRQQEAERIFKEGQQKLEDGFNRQQEEKERAFQAQQQAAEDAYQAAKQERDRQFAEEQRTADRAFEQSQREAERTFKAEQRALDQQSAEQIRALLASSGVSGNIPGRRTGGPVDAGRPYWVGEAGKELIIPRQPGYVLNASQAAAVARRYMMAPTGGMAALPQQGDPRLLRAINELNANLARMKPGVTVQHLSQSVTNQVPRNERAIAAMVERSNLQLLRSLQSSLGA